MNVVKLAKRVVGIEFDPVAAAEKRVADARVELARIDGQQNDALRVAREAFERDETEDAADNVVRIEQRTRLMTGTARKKLESAEAELATVHGAAQAARLAELDATVAGVADRIAALTPKALEHAQALLELLEERGRIVNEGLEALEEAAALRGTTHTEGTRGARVDLGLKTHLLRQRLGQELGYAKRDLLEDLFR